VGRSLRVLITVARLASTKKLSGHRTRRTLPGLTLRRSGAQFGTNFLCNFTPENGRSEIVATTSVGDAVRASNSRGQSDVRTDRRLYAPFNSHEPNSLVEGAQRDSTPRTSRLERSPFIRYLSIERGQGNSLCSERPCRPRPSESATMSSDCLRKKIKRRSASRPYEHAP
jgi:hypothetical protein